MREKNKEREKVCYYSDRDYWNKGSDFLESFYSSTPSYKLKGAFPKQFPSPKQWFWEYQENRSETGWCKYLSHSKTWTFTFSAIIQTFIAIPENHPSLTTSLKYDKKADRNQLRLLCY